MIKQNTTKPTFFVDRALGKNLVRVLRNCGANVEAHKDHFLPNSPDVEWLPDVSQRGWIVLTKDANLGRNISEQVVIGQSNAQVFILAAGDANGEEIADTFMQALESIERFIQGNKAPFIARIYKYGKVELWQSSTKLKRLAQSQSQGI